MRKAQTLTADYMSGITVFAVVILISISVWNVAEGKKNWSYDIDRMQRKAMYAADTLLKSEGLPSGWTPANVDEIGIAESDHVINGSLVDNMLLVNYDKARSAFGLEIYEFYINITNYTGGQIAGYGMPPQNVRDLAAIQRMALFQNQSPPVRAVITFYVWR